MRIRCPLRVGPFGCTMVRVGLAMLQGARHEHIEALHGAALELGVTVEVVELRRGDQVDGNLDALVLPGGESTAMRKASESEALLPALFTWMDQHPNRPVLGTCAGAILLASPGGEKEPYIATSVSRNAWGRQRQSFEALLSVDLTVPDGSVSEPHVAQADRFNHRPLPVSPIDGPSQGEGFHGVFIRAPRFESSSVQCEAIVHLDTEVVGVLDGARMALTFHPELTTDRRFHRWLLARADD